MARGFLSGIIWGGVVSVIGAAAVSVMATDPVPPVVDAQAPSSAQAPEAGEASTPEAVTDADLVIGSDTPQVQSPQADTVAAATVAGSDTQTDPETGQADDLPTPAQSSDTGAVAIGDTSSVQPGTQTDAPTAPDAPSFETELSISTVPAQPAPPSVPEAPSAFAPEADETPTAPVAEAAAPRTTAPAEVPTAPAAPDTAARVEADEASDDPAIAEVTDETDTADDMGEQIAALPNVQAPQTDRGITVGRPAVSLVDRTPDMPAGDATASSDDLAGGDTRAITRFGIPFDNPENKPLMAIVLMDGGTDLTGGPVGLAALRSFPYPLTFAVDATLPDAATRMADYRAQGFEVMALMNLPQGATASDAEVALAAALDRVPEAVAIMEGAATGLQDSREASEQIAQAVLETGHGLVLQSKGLNTVHKLATRSGVPAGLIFRDFDSAGQTPTVIRRFLDQAAFRAGQEGGVIMVGRVRPDTISALLLWGLQDRAERVSLAPVSAVLTALDTAQ
jgi:polysaccharide deacetylase 2 family uncharacterized protein YibQ